MKHGKAFLKLAEEARTRVKELSPDEVKAKFDQNEPFTLIDVREESERASGYIPNSIHLSKGQLESHIESIVPDMGAEIVVHCRGGFRSILAADNLQKMGYSNVKSMTGGIRAWHQAGYPSGDVLEE